MSNKLVPGFQTEGPTVEQTAGEGHCSHEEDEDLWRRLEEHPAIEEVHDARPGEVPQGAVRGDPRIQRRYAPEEIAEMESIRSPR